MSTQVAFVLVVLIIGLTVVACVWIERDKPYRQEPGDEAPGP